MNVRSTTTATLLAALFATGCPKQEPVAPISLVADPPPTDDGKVPGVDVTALDRGRAFIEKGAWSEAVPEFGTVLDRDPTNAEAHYYRALALKNLGKTEDARAGFEKALELDSTLIDARAHLGEIFLLAEPPLPEEAIEMLEPAVKAQPEATDTRELLAYAHFLLQHWGQAADHYGELVKKKEDDHKLRYQLADTLFLAGRLDESVVHMRKLMEPFGNELKLVIQFADRFGKAKAFEDCVKGFDRALELAPNKAAFHVRRGVCKHHLEQEKEARLDYLKAIEANDKYQPAYFYLGKSWLHEQRRQRALEAFKKCIQLDPESKIAKRAEVELEAMKKASRRK